jgi:membrane protein implicated in regulation of membrane protease activity
MAYEKYGIIVLVIVILVFLYFLCRRWKKRRERRALEIDSARADNVLGDMAMVPRYDSDEEDENGDLI